MLDHLAVAAVSESVSVAAESVAAAADESVSVVDAVSESVSVAAVSTVPVWDVPVWAELLIPSPMVMAHRKSFATAQGFPSVRDYPKKGTGAESSSNSGEVASTRTRPMVTFSLREKGGGDWQQKGTGSFLRMVSLTCQLQRQAKTCLSPFDVHQNEKTPLRDHECPYDFLVFRQRFKYSFDHKSIRYISLHPVNCPNGNQRNE